MLTKDCALSIVYAIRRECSKVDLTEWCHYWDFTTEDFDELLDYALRYMDLQE